MIEQRLNAYKLLDALSENSNMQEALTNLLKETGCTAYFNSAKMLNGLCSALKKAGMNWELIQILIGASEKTDVGLRTMACERFCHLIHKLAAEDAMFADKMFLAAISCQDSDDSKDLSVKYFESLFADGYFQRKEIQNDQLSPVIKRAQTMILSAEPVRMWAAHHFFTEFMTHAKAEQFAVLSKDIPKKWEEHAETHKKTIKPLWEQYQKRTSEALSGS